LTKINFVNIGEQIKAYRKQNKVSMPKISQLTGIPTDRLYKWEKGTKPSDVEDVRKMEAFFSGKLENVPRENSRTERCENDQELITALQALNAERLDRIAELKLRLNNVERLMASLETLSENQALIGAQVGLAVDLLVEVHPTLRKIKDPVQVAHALDKRLAPKIEKALKMDKT
jgi:transcriptional regulator with XRE-family HTH domain